MKSFISSRGASPECVCTGKLAAWHAAHTGSYDGSLYGVWSRHIVGIMIPRIPGLSASHSISATARSTSWQIGTSPTPARRSGLVAHSSTRNRLWARAPANASSGSSIMPAESPAPNGGDSMPVIASASGKITSAATPSASISLSRCSASYAPRRPSSCVGLPVGDVVVVQLHLLVALRVALGEELVELRRGTATSRYGRYSSHGSPACASAEMIDVALVATSRSVLPCPSTDRSS